MIFFLCSCVLRVVFEFFFVFSVNFNSSTTVFLCMIMVVLELFLFVCMFVFYKIMFLLNLIDCGDLVYFGLNSTRKSFGTFRNSVRCTTASVFLFLIVIVMCVFFV